MKPCLIYYASTFPSARVNFKLKKKQKNKNDSQVTGESYKATFVKRKEIKLRASYKWEMGHCNLNMIHRPAQPPEEDKFLIQP